jgi:hypothetical protein
MSPFVIPPLSDKITGPFSPAKMIRMRRAKQFKKSDTVGFSKDGPFMPIANLHVADNLATGLKLQAEEN